MLEEDEIYAAVDQGAPCTFGEVFLTAGRNEANELYILEDDKGFFTSYHPALNVRIPVLREHPRLEPVFEAIAAELTTERLRSLNARVAVEGAPPDEVARDFLEASGFTR